VRQWHVRDIDFYYDLLASRTVALDFWKTDYLHILPNAEAIVEWYKGTALRPFLDALESAAGKEQFTSEYLELIRPYYPPHPGGRVLLPFPRMFLIAYR
jgi:trans-aconitate 2-methyltransferase